MSTLVKKQLNPKNTVRKSKISNTFNETKDQNIKSPFTSVMGWITYGATFLLSKYFGVLVILIILIPSLIGLAFAGWWSKKGEKGRILIEIIAWSNIISWLFPIAGYFTGASTFIFGSANNIQNNKKYLWLGVIGFLASLINSISGILINYK